MLQEEEEKKAQGETGIETEREPLAKGGLKSERKQVSARFKELEVQKTQKKRTDKSQITELTEKEVKELKDAVKIDIMKQAAF